MAWTTVPTFTAGQVLTAAQMNGLGNDLNVLRGDFDSFRRTSGNITLTGTTTWSDLVTIGTTADLILKADTGDLLEASILCLLGNEAVDLALDVITVVGTTKTNSMSTGGAVPANTTAFGGTGWYRIGNQFGAISGSLFYVAQAGDISSSTVKCRVQYATHSAVNRTLYGTAQYPFFFCVRNHGPVLS